jgi:hypothetical protein
MPFYSLFPVKCSSFSWKTVEIVHRLLEYMNVKILERTQLYLLNVHVICICNCMFTVGNLDAM